jgi:hypothetical protein
VIRFGLDHLTRHRRGDAIGFYRRSTARRWLTISGRPAVGSAYVACAARVLDDFTSEFAGQERQARRHSISLTQRERLVSVRCRDSVAFSLRLVRRCGRGAQRPNAGVVGPAQRKTRSAPAPSAGGSARKRMISTGRGAETAGARFAPLFGMRTKTPNNRSAESGFLSLHLRYPRRSGG